MWTIIVKIIFIILLSDAGINNVISYPSTGYEALFANMTGIPIPSKNRSLYGANPEEMGPYFQGDLLIPPSLRRNGMKDEIYRWPNAEIPYEIVGNFTNNETSIIKKAMNEYHKYTCIKFTPRRSTDLQYLSIENNNTGCHSHIGVDTVQICNLQSPLCVNDTGTPIHELMHVVGFLHEQNRDDRDEYIKVNYENISPDNYGQFDKLPPGVTTAFGMPYDYASIMHYSIYAGTINGKPTIVPLKPTNITIGEHQTLSPIDIKKINLMYKCPEKSNLTTSNSSSKKP